LLFYVGAVFIGNIYCSSSAIAETPDVLLVAAPSINLVQEFNAHFSAVRQESAVANA
jgi:hypothetical protein